MREARWFRSCLRKDEFEFVTGAQHEIGSSLGADTNPIHTARGQSRPVRLDRHCKAEFVERSNEIIIKLQQRLTTSADDERVSER